MNNEKLQEMEKAAYYGQLDFNDFPAAEYRFFDRIQDIGYRVRHEALPKELAAEEREKARRDYDKDLDERQERLRIYRKYQEAILKTDSLICGLEKTDSREEKLRLALEALSLLTGDEGLVRRNLRE